MKDQSSNYVPGVCNINYAEIRKRRSIGFIGLAALLVVLTFLSILKAPAIVWTITFLPAFLMTTGFLQAKNKFCVGYAAAGMRHTAKDAEKVEDDGAVATDKQRARRMNLQVVIVALLITVASVMLGSLIN